MFGVALDERLDEGGFSDLETVNILSFLGFGGFYSRRSSDSNDDGGRFFWQAVDQWNM